MSHIRQEFLHKRDSGNPILLDGSSLRIADLVEAALGNRPVTLDEAAWNRIRQGRALIETIVDQRIPAYGINTGVGSQKDFTVTPQKVTEFNRRLLTAHATRIPGPTLRPEEVRAAMIIQINLFASGACGVRPDLVELFLKRLAAGQIPTVDASGSVGASDLVPLAQLALGILDNSFPLAAKEALSLMNSNAISLARGALQLYELRRLLAAFDVSAAIALEGIRGNLNSISQAVNQVHARQGQSAVAARLRALLAQSRLWEAGQARFLQDPLSFRCISQVHGVGYSTLQWAWDIWETELNAVTDNPIVDLTSYQAISHGNMDSTAITLTVDTLGQILAKISDLSGERIHKLHWPIFSGLPTGLSDNTGEAIGGVQFLNLGHIASSLIASQKLWASPHLLHGPSQLSDGVEDTASFGLHAVSDLERAIDGGWKIVAVEMIIGTWAIHRRRIPIEKLGTGIRPVVKAVLPLLPIGREGKQAPFDIGAIVKLLKNGWLIEKVLADFDEIVA